MPSKKVGEVYNEVRNCYRRYDAKVQASDVAVAVAVALLDVVAVLGRCISRRRGVFGMVMLWDGMKRSGDQMVAVPCYAADIWLTSLPLRCCFLGRRYLV